MNDALSYNQALDDELSRRGIEHTSETPPIEDLPISVNMGRVSIDLKKYSEFGTYHLVHWFQLLEEWHPRHICVVNPSFANTITWYKQSQGPIPTHLRVYKPEAIEAFDPGSLEFYDPKKHRTIYRGMIGQEKYYVLKKKPGFTRVDVDVEDGSVAVIWPADPGHRAREMVISNVDRFRRQLARCHGKKPRARFQVFPLLLVPGGGPDHANMIVIDTVQGTITRFEPHGATTTLYDQRDIDMEIGRVLVPVIESALGISIVRIVTPSDFCPAEGLQVAEVRQTRYFAVPKIAFDGKIVNADKDGYCDAWSAMWLHYRILNPNKSDKQVYDMIHTGWNDLATKIRAYVTAVVTSFMNKLAKEKEDTLSRGR